MRQVILCLIAALAIAAATGSGSGSGTGQPTVTAVKSTVLAQRSTLFTEAEVNAAVNAFKNNLVGTVDKVVFGGQALVNLENYGDLLEIDSQDAADFLATTYVRSEYILYPSAGVTPTALQNEANTKSSAIGGAIQDATGATVTITNAQSTVGTDCDTKCISENPTCPNTCAAGKSCSSNSQCQSNVCSNSVCTNPYSAASSLATSVATVAILAASAAVAQWM